MALNRKALDNFVDTLRAQPLGMSTFEDALNLVTSTGISARLACIAGVHERLMRVASDADSEPNLVAVFPSGEVGVKLSRCAPDAWEGIFSAAVDDFFLLLSHEGKTARAQLHGSCAAAIEGHYLKDKTIPVIGLWDLGAAMVEVLTGQGIPPGGFHSERNELTHRAQRAVELLSGIAAQLRGDSPVTAPDRETKGDTAS